LTSLLWFYAQANVGFSANIRTLLLDDVVHLFTFILVSWLTSLVYKKTMLLEVTSKELARSNLELEQFAARAAHDLQSPLASILGFTELLKEKYETAGDAETQDFTNHIIESVKRASAFIKALLKLLRLQLS
jgi:light-regulated signal transduction histidine kinase (bacteriophytochrome)